jgi:hypothetical protein
MSQLEIFWHYHHKEEIMDFSYSISSRQIGHIKVLSLAPQQEFLGYVSGVGRYRGLCIHIRRRKRLSLLLG